MSAMGEKRTFALGSERLLAASGWSAPGRDGANADAHEITG